MAKIRCDCGHIIVDQSDNLSYKGYIIPDTLMDQGLTNLVSKIDSLLEAIQSDKKKEWINTTFSSDYPKDLEVSSMIYDLISVDLLSKTKEIFECENCGRILIKKEGGGFQSYISDRGTLK